MRLSLEEKRQLRDVAKKVREISLNETWKEKTELWKDKNSLKKVRPLVLCSLPDTKNLWGYFQTQEFSEVSPDMLEEFVLPYKSRIAQRFGLNSYGCCEPNDRKWEAIMRYISNLRELSVSHAANLEIAADRLKGNYVFSWKPHPAKMIATFDKAYVERELKAAMKITKDCCLIICVRDVLSLFGKPERAGKWIDIAMRLVGGNQSMQ